MKILKKLLLVFMTMSIITLNVYAEDTKNITFKAEYGGDNIAIVEDSLVTSVNNSSLPVKVVKVNDDEETTIYTGLLGGYDNGNWINTDFSKIQFMAIYNWETIEDEVIYIIPIQNLAVADKTTVSDKADTTKSVLQKSMVQTTSDDVGIDISLLYDNVYSECVLNPGTDLTADVKLENTNEILSADVSAMIALYDENSKLIDIKMESNIVLPNDNGVLNPKITVPNNSVVASAKIMVWSGTSLKPFTNAVMLTLSGTDYFGDDYSLAQNMGNRNSASGLINSESDADVFEFKVLKEGLYTFESYGTTDTYATLSNKLTPAAAIISDDNSGIDNNFRLSANLSEGQTYYLKVTGSTLGKYKIVSNYAIGNVFGTVSPVKAVGEHDFDVLIESKCALYTFDSNEFVAQMHLQEYTTNDDEYARFSLVGVSAGEYLVKISRMGYLSRYLKIVLNDNAVDLGNKVLVAGDVNDDGVIDSSDLTLLRNSLNSEFGTASYNINADLNGDKIVNSLDEYTLISNVGKTSNSYNDNVTFINFDVSVNNYLATIIGKSKPNEEITCSVYLGDIFVSEENVVCGIDGLFSTTVELSKNGTYTVSATSNNRAFDVVKTISCN